MKSPKILFVEDEPIIGLDIKNTLLGLGYDVSQVISSGEEAVKEAEEFKPDIILMDIILPGEMDGIEAVKKIQEKHTIPIIYLTARTEKITFGRAKETAPYGYLVKPVGKNDLYTAIETALHRHETEKKYHSLYTSMNEGLCTHEIIYDDSGKPVDYRILDVNPKYESILGIDRDKAINAIASELYGANEPPYLDIYSRVAETGEPASFETYFPPIDMHFTISVFSPGKGSFVTVFQDITEQKRAEEALRESEERFRNLADMLPEVVFEIDKQFNITYANQAGLKIFGYTQKDLDKELNATALFVPDSLQKALKRIEEILSGEKSYANEYNCIKKDGTTFPVLIHIDPINKDESVVGFRGVLVDITERKKAEKALHKERDFAESLIKTAQVIIMVLDTKGRIVRINPYMEKISGYRLEEVQDKDWFITFLPKREQDSIRKLFLKAVGNIETRGNVNPIVTKDGREREIEWYDKTLKDTDGNVIGVLAVGQDITGRKKAEKQIKSSLLEKETLLKEIHHRVKNNMQVITSLLSLQEREIEDKGLQSIFRSSENRIRAMALVHEKLYQSENLSEIDFGEYIRIMVTELYQTYMCDPEMVELDIKAQKPQLGIGQAIPCGLILNELITNAIKHAFPPELKRKGKIRISLKEKDDTIELAVKDNGIGIPKDIDIDKVNSLGLTLVSSLAKSQLKGKLDIDRKKGTTFTVMFRKGD